jgi:hypothetical protein
MDWNTTNPFGNPDRHAYSDTHAYLNNYTDAKCKL